MQTDDDQSWSTDPAVFAAIRGGPDVVAWFGFTPSFHDANLLGVDISCGSATLRINAFRMTDAIDSDGMFVLDKQVVVVIEMHGVTGVSLVGDAQSIIFELGIRCIATAPSGFDTCSGPQPGTYEVSFQASYGLEGSIYSKELSVKLGPSIAV
jgi:hypothetical protein